MIYKASYISPLGPLCLTADDGGLTAVWLEAAGTSPVAEHAELCERPELPALTSALHWLERYFSGTKPDLSGLLLAPQGTPFQMEVWEILKTIPYGQTMTYRHIAQQMAERRGIPRMASQAVGGAVGSNPLSIIVPCHRVVGAHGNLTGYGGGLENKRKLLEMEGADVLKFTLPRHIRGQSNN